MKWLVILICFIATCASSALVLSESGKTSFAITVAPEAIAAEKTAAKELQEHLHQVTGATFEVRDEKDVAGDSPQILVGQSRRLRDLAPDVDFAALDQEGVLIRVAGNKLLLAGGGSRGTLYAVYTFLEEVAGCRWWTSSEATIPHKPTLDVPDDLNVLYTPKLKYREAFYEDVLDGKFVQAARLKVNGHHNRAPSEWGGHYEILGWCHTSYQLLPPAQYFNEHPDWYSERGGKRNPDGGQLCWSNEAMRAELARVAIERIRKRPDAGIISISQNDWIGNCQCEKCRAIDAEEGSPSGSLIRGVNAIAAEIGKQYPNFLVETLAYQYTRHPPKRTRPAKNVLVRLCSIECDFAHPLSGPTNKSFGDDLRGWSAIAPNLFVWNYVTDFSNYHVPFPNMTPLGADLRFFIDHHVVGVFEQGDAFNAGVGDFLQLRCWLLAHLMWDPSRDQTKLRDEFLDGYYGAAGTALGKYLDLINGTASGQGFQISCGTGDFNYLTKDVIDRADQLFDEAERAVASDQTLLRRVRRERLSLEYVKLTRWDHNGRVAAFRKAHPNQPIDAAAVCGEYNAAVDRYCEAAKRQGARHLSEPAPFDALETSLQAACAEAIPPDLPAAGAKLPAGTFDVQEDGFKLAGVGEWSQIVDDPRASNGKAVRMPGGSGQWAVQLHVGANSPFAGKGPWRCYVVIRCDAKQRAGSGFQYGIFDPARGMLAHKIPSAQTVGDNEYHAYLLSASELRPGTYFWVAPPGNGNVEAVYVDRVVIVRDLER